MHEYVIEKLAFFAPNHKKSDLKVIPFGSVNAPEFYTCMMDDFKVEWDTLFNETMSSLAVKGPKPDGALIRVSGEATLVGKTTPLRYMINYQ